MSAKNLCETYGFGSYQTAWAWLRKLRSVMIRNGRERLGGRVEVDETYVGGQKKGTRGRGAEGKTLVLVAVEGIDKEKLGRVRFRCVETIDQETANAFVRDYVEEGSTIVTDGLSAYDKLKSIGFDHRPHVLKTGGRLLIRNLPTCISSSPCSNAGLGALTRGPLLPLTSRHTSMNLPFASTVVFPSIVANSSIGSCNRR